MRTVRAIYRGRTLTAVESDGWWQVEIDAEGNGILMLKQPTLEEAMAAARHFLDLPHRTLN